MWDRLFSESSRKRKFIRSDSRRIRDMSPRLFGHNCALVSPSFAKYNGYGRLSHWFVHLGKLFLGWTDFSFKLSANKLFKKCCHHHHHWDHIEIWQIKVLPAALVHDDIYHHYHHYLPAALVLAPPHLLQIATKVTWMMIINTHRMKLDEVVVNFKASFWKLPHVLRQKDKTSSAYPIAELKSMPK